MSSLSILRCNETSNERNKVKRIIMVKIHSEPRTKERMICIWIDSIKFNLI